MSISCSKVKQVVQQPLGNRAGPEEVAQLDRPVSAPPVNLVAVSRLKKSLGQAGRSAIQSIRGEGYRLGGPDAGEYS
jgi:hypothetical protein